MNIIQNKDHNNGAYRITKPSLSCYNDKKCILEEEYHGLSHLHKSTN